MQKIVKTKAGYLLALRHQLAPAGPLSNDPSQKRAQNKFFSRALVRKLMHNDDDDDDDGDQLPNKRSRAWTRSCQTNIAQRQNGLNRFGLDWCSDLAKKHLCVYRYLKSDHYFKCAHRDEEKTIDLLWIKTKMLNNLNVIIPMAVYGWESAFH